MSSEEFQQRIRSHHKGSNNFNYILAVVVIVAGLGLAYFFYNDSSGFSVPGIAIPAFIVSAGIYMIWRIPMDYVVKEIRSQKADSLKAGVIRQYFSSLNVEWLTEEDNFIHCRYMNRYWNKVDVYLLLTPDSVIVNVQGVDWRAHKGVIDFGLTRRARKRLVKYLDQYL